LKQEIIPNDCLLEMQKMESNSISAIITDPPYGLKFMGKEWDHGIPHVIFWKEALRIAKPGAFLLSFGGTRTFHRLTCAIEDSGWEIRDCLMWLYGSGFPKSHNHFGLEGYGTALKPAWEPIIMAMKPCDGTFAQNAEKWGQAGINISATRVPLSGHESSLEPSNQRIVSFSSIESYRDGLACISSVLRAYNNSDKDHLRNALCLNGNLLSAYECEMILNLLYPNGVWCGLNWKAIPSFQVDCPAYSRLRDELIPSVLKNAQVSAPLLGDALDDIYHWIFSHTNNHLWRCNDLLSIEDVSALLHALIDPLFNPTLYLHQQKKSIGRWPANLLLDEVAAEMLDEQSGHLTSGSNCKRKKPHSSNALHPLGILNKEEISYGDSGGASRFFYCAKASPSERGECNNHPTVKPLKLMEYLIKLVMPSQDGILLDPFAGSGTTILAAKNLGYNAIGIEKDETYCEIARMRLEAGRQMALYNSENKEIFCKCGKKSSMVIIAKDRSLILCSECAGFNDQKPPEFVYKPPTSEVNKCCKRFYVEYDPLFGIPNGDIYVKEDGSRCPIHDERTKADKRETNGLI
jgi:DNA modification methylase